MSESVRKSKKFLPALNDKLEDRTVPSHMGWGSLVSQVANFDFGFGFGRGGLLGGGHFGGGFGRHGGDLGGIGLPGSGGASTSTLKQDARQVQQAFQTLNS